jgi:transposase
MATIQSKNSRGYKYWYIVESRRINGKPRPVVLAYLGTANNLLERLQGLSKGLTIKSYSHGEVSALLNVASEIDMASIINKYIQSPREYFNTQPVRNNLTAGFTYLLGAIGRACMLTSKRGWYHWAKTTSLEYLLRLNLSKVDSQHFWDLMDALPEENIPKVEEEIIKKVFRLFSLQSDTLFYDTTNFYTYIATTNNHCDIAQRGKNKQKRGDLRQVGMALVVNREDHIPLFHQVYRGNMNDVTVFKSVIINIIDRLVQLGLDVNNHTFVFDRGNNSKRNLALAKELNIFYVGALTPCYHKELIVSATDNFQTISVGKYQLDHYRTKRVIWGEEKAIIVFISDRLRHGQIRGLYQKLDKKEKSLIELQNKLLDTRAKNRNRKQLEDQIHNILNDDTKDLISWQLQTTDTGKYILEYWLNKDELQRIEDHFGFRIIMTNRHHWETHMILQAYFGQSEVEEAFKTMKNPYHLPVRPQFHWTDQKIKVHYFICVMAYLLVSLIWRRLKKDINFNGCINTMCNLLKNIRLTTLLEKNNKNGRIKATYRLEQMDEKEKQILEALGLLNYHNQKHEFRNLSVYI